MESGKCGGYYYWRVFLPRLPRLSGALSGRDVYYVVKYMGRICLIIIGEHKIHIDNRAASIAGQMLNPSLRIIQSPKRRLQRRATTVGWMLKPIPHGLRRKQIQTKAKIVGRLLKPRILCTNS